MTRLGELDAGSDFGEQLMSLNGMVRPCSCPASDESGKGLQRQGARHVPESQQRNCRDRH
jgi:hypothetical protein